MQYLILRSISQSTFYLRKTTLYTQFQQTAGDGFESEETSESSGDDEVIGDKHLTNSSDSDYETPNVEPENIEKDVEGLFTVTRSGRTATNWRTFGYGFY